MGYFISEIVETFDISPYIVLCVPEILDEKHYQLTMDWAVMDHRSLMIATKGA